MSADRPVLRRCAVYTRKSSEEGLDQDFNSLQAQREACVAYIASQRSEGWQLIPTAYDDGGISGGTMERPSLQRMMADIEAGLIDVIVVYKVDRLTRSLSDFSKMVEVFDRQGVSFVAVTQQFNTTTSMGRLTLNVLLSFAQFEREVTGERIRDKIAASKKKGIWMGGVVPLGYRVEERKLLVVPEDAAVVRDIYQRYLACSSVRELAHDLKRDGITSKRKARKEGHILSDGALYVLLSNPIYIGQIVHKGARYAGQHAGIVDLETWSAVQAKLLARTVSPDAARRKTGFSPLMGKLFDEAGNPLSPHHSCKHGRRYRYYVSRPEHQENGKSAWRLPAKDFERCVAAVVAEMVGDKGLIASEAIAKGMDAESLDSMLILAEKLRGENGLRWVTKIELGSGQIVVTIHLPGTTRLELRRAVPMVLKRRGIERRMVIHGSTRSDAHPDARIVTAIGRSLRYWEQLKSGQCSTLKEIAEAEKLDDRYVSRVLPLAFLAPDVLTMFLRGQQPPEWTAERLLRNESLPVSWEEQRKVF